MVQPREFKTGSFGYYVNRKVPLLIGGRRVLFQLQCQLVAVNSKHSGGRRKRKRGDAARPGF
jgi:hypothetical protein